MTHYARIDTIEVTGDTVFVSRTEGETPPPQAQAGTGISWTTKADFVAALAEAEDRVKNDLWLIRLGKAYKADPTMGATFQTVAKAGPVPVLDLTGVAQTLTV